MSYIHISLIRPLKRFNLRYLRRVLENAFGMKTNVVKSDLDISFAYDPSRGQYHASALLLRLSENPPADASRVLSITDADLFVPIFEYLFGEAQFNGLGAVISSYMLHNERYGLPADRVLLSERLSKEAIHELGHTFGLTHCFSPYCVMNPSTVVEQIDAKSMEFCAECRHKIEGKSA